MTLPPQQVTSVRWTAVFPWLILARAARVALMLRVIVLALLGVAATHGGWLLIESSPLGHRALRELELEVGLQTQISTLFPPALHDSVDGPLTIVKSDWTLGPIFTSWRWMVQPFGQLLQAADWGAWTALALAGLWSLAVWALFGGAIARIAGVYLTYGETLGPLAALRSSARKWPSTVGAPLLVVFAIALLALPLVLAGLLLRFDLMALLLGLAWIVALIGGAAVAILAVGLTIGWPLMFSTVAVERTDAFDAISRGFAYVYQRPLHLLFYLIVASLLGILAQAAVDLAATATTTATEFAVSVGAGQGRLGDLGVDGKGVSDDVSDVGAFGGAAMHFWTNVVRAAAVYFPLAYLWPASTAIYLLLRRGIDATEMSEVAFDEGEPKVGLPRLAPDVATGVPQVARPETKTR
ncbi:MAG: hypothetical protein C0485_04475 [Pirellula sp.]|nr:hypothetical protein [Pirellula sp.]